MSPTPTPHEQTPASTGVVPPDWLSAAVDGDADGLDRACAAMAAGDERTRADWRTYHLIGDVLRSADLATPPARDAAFLAGLREKLAAEPVVLAPAPLAAPPARPRAAGWAAGWRFPAAAVAGVAGVAVVAGALVLSRSADTGPGLAAAPVLRDGMQRDARLDELMRLHQSAHVGLALPRTEPRPVDLVVEPASGR
jgi:sigma-E factor negative regulatory protein RseA